MLVSCVFNPHNIPLKEAISEAIIRDTNLFKIAFKFYLENKRPLTLAIDVSIYYFHFLKIAQSKSIPQQSRWILSKFMIFLTNLLKLNIVPYLVLDGPHRPSFKRNKTIQTTAHSKESLLVQGLTQLAQCLNLEIIHSPGEAEAQCAYLQKTGYVDYVLTDDIDAIVFGATRVLCDYRNVSKGGNGNTHTTVSVIDMENVRSMYNVDTTGLVLIALFSGGDYNVEGLKNAGVRMAMEAANINTQFSQRLIDIFKLNYPYSNDWTGEQKSMLRQWHSDIISQCRKLDANSAPVPKPKLKPVSRKSKSNIIPDDNSDNEGLEIELLPSLTHDWHFSRRYNIVSLPDNFPEYSHLSLYISPVVDQKFVQQSYYQPLPTKLPVIDFEMLREFTYTMLPEEWSYGFTIENGRVSGQWKFIKIFTELKVIQRLLYDTVSPKNMLFTILKEQSLGENNEDFGGDTQDVNENNGKELRIEVFPFNLFAFEDELDLFLTTKRAPDSIESNVEIYPIAENNGVNQNDEYNYSQVNNSNYNGINPRNSNIHDSSKNSDKKSVNTNNPVIPKRISIPAYWFDQSPVYKSVLDDWNKIKADKSREQREKEDAKKLKSTMSLSLKSKGKSRSDYNSLFSRKTISLNLDARAARDTAADNNRVFAAKNLISDEVRELLFSNPTASSSDRLLCNSFSQSPESSDFERDDLSGIHSSGGLKEVRDMLLGRTSSEGLPELSASKGALTHLSVSKFASLASDSALETYCELPQLGSDKTDSVARSLLPFRRSQSEISSTSKFSKANTSYSELLFISSQEKTDGDEPLFVDSFDSTDDFSFENLDRNFNSMDKYLDSNVIPGDQVKGGNRIYIPNICDNDSFPDISIQQSHNSESSKSTKSSELLSSKFERNDMRVDSRLDFRANKSLPSIYTSNLKRSLSDGPRKDSGLVREPITKMPKVHGDVSIILDNNNNKCSNSSYVSISDGDNDDDISIVNQYICISHSSASRTPTIVLD